MITAMLLAAQSPEPQAFTPTELKAVEEIMRCEKQYVDTLPGSKKRERGSALIDDAWPECETQNKNLHATFSKRFNPRAADRAMQVVREVLRENLPGYINR